MTLTEIGDLLELGSQLLQIACPSETPDGAELLVSGTTRPNEVRVVGVGESIRARTGRGENRALLEHEHCATGARERENSLDRIDAFRVGDGMTATVCDPELDAFFRRETRNEFGALGFGGAKLEMRRPRTTERRTAEEHPAQVCTSTASTCDDASRR